MSLRAYNPLREAFGMLQCFAALALMNLGRNCCIGSLLNLKTAQVKLQCTEAIQTLRVIYTFVPHDTKPFILYTLFLILYSF